MANLCKTCVKKAHLSKKDFNAKVVSDSLKDFCCYFEYFFPFVPFGTFPLFLLLMLLLSLKFAVFCCCVAILFFILVQFFLSFAS